MKELTLSQKYDFYERAVQNPQSEVDFMHKWFHHFYKKKAKVLREDFCGTAAISHLWVKSAGDTQAIGIDLDPEPLAIGKMRHGVHLKPSELKRLTVLNENVLKPQKFKVDIICAFNFSYFIFKKRSELLAYFKQAKLGLANDGVLFIDLFGGPDSQKLVTETKEMKKDLKYYWQCQKFNPINHFCTFAIHFKHKNVKYNNVFQYDWRLWTIPELNEILIDAGFSKIQVFWEGDGEDGTGDGVFTPVEDAENCLAWVSYIAALP